MNSKNSYSIKKLKDLTKRIENISNYEYYHSKILTIIQNNNMVFSENKNGVFINMNNLNDTCLNEIEKYLTYIDNQNKNIENVEKIKNEFKNDFFHKVKQNKSDINSIIQEQSVENTVEEKITINY